MREEEPKIISREEAIIKIREKLQRITMSHGSGGEEVARVTQVLEKLESDSTYSVDNAARDIEQIAITDRRNEVQPPIEQPIDNKHKTNIH
jgi:hypothetical protein